ncbi:sigma-70 family RNA polymerase sigma factor [Gottfriedia sp. S16(2024)]|uniref:sigma-70 family RNA polymerase sigma factor n=1 Tax=Gottfriedia sp. S16(2024) TaxID=3162883 RepID=UPI003D1F85E4
MKELTKDFINGKVFLYLEKGIEDDFSDFYKELKNEYQSKLRYWSKNTFMANMHDIQELFDDTVFNVMNVIKKDGGDFVKLFQLRLVSRYKSLLRKLIVRRAHEDYDFDKSSADPEAATFELADDFNLEEKVITDLTGKKKADQRQLIDSFLDGADADTTAIVNAFLTHPKPTATAIAKELGVHHSKVLRNFERLGGTFDYKQFGDYRDYLFAI